MATATTKTEDQETAAPEASDSPVLDLLDAAVKRLIKAGKSRGYVTYDELNEVLPPDEVSPDQIEDIMTMFSDLGVNVVDAEEVEEAAAAEPLDDEEEDRRPRSCPSNRSAAPRSASAPTTQCACTCAKWARSSFCRARARSPSPSASRPAAKP